MTKTNHQNFENSWRQNFENEFSIHFQDSKGELQFVLAFIEEEKEKSWKEGSKQAVKENLTTGEIDLIKEFEELFPKGELCRCGRKLMSRSKALVLLGLVAVRDQQIRNAVRAITAKCTCGCDFGDACLCKERREGVERCKKEVLKILKCSN